MMNFDVHARLFLAASRFVSDEETRYYLNGVFIQPHRDGVTLTATDGRRLIHILDRQGHCGELNGSIVRVPKAYLKHLKPGRKRDPERRLRVEHNVARVLDGEGWTDPIKVEEIDGTFPDYPRVMPRSPWSAGTVQTFTPSDFKDLAEAAKDLNIAFTGSESGRFKLVDHDGPTGVGAPAALVFDDPKVEAIGAVMPIKAGTYIDEIPEWFGKLPDEARQAA